MCVLPLLGVGERAGNPYPRLLGPLQGVRGAVPPPPPAKFNSEPNTEQSFEGVAELREGVAVGPASPGGPAPGCSLPPLGARLAGSQPPSFLLTGNDFPSLCSHFLRLPNWISDPVGGEGLEGEGLGAAGWDAAHRELSHRYPLQGGLGQRDWSRASPFLGPGWPRCPGFAIPQLGPFPRGLKSLRRPQCVCVSVCRGSAQL